MMPTADRSSSLLLKAISSMLAVAAILFVITTAANAQTQTPTPVGGLVTGTGPGANHVKRFSGAGLTLSASFFAYSPVFPGGVRVAAGDITGDGVAEIITAPGQGGGPHVRIFHGGSLEEIGSFFAYPTTFTGGVFVAVGDVNGDGSLEIITGTDAGTPALIKVFDGVAPFTERRSVMPFGGFQGGVSVAVGDVNNDGIADIIAGTGPGGGRVAVLDGLSNTILLSEPYGPSYAGGIWVASGDVDLNGHAEIITGANSSPGGHVKVFDGRTFSEVRSYFAFDPNFTGGARVAVGTRGALDLNDLYIFVGAGPGSGPRVKVYNGQSGAEVNDFLAYDQAFSGGVFVASTTPPKRPRSPLVHVNVQWANVPNGQDPDGQGPATEMGWDAFATMQGGVAAVRGGGRVVGHPGITLTEILIGIAVDISGSFTASGGIRFTSPGGSLSPGFSPGTINSGNLTFVAGNTLNVELNGTAPGTQYDQVNVTGTVNLGGATLAIEPGYVPTPGHQFRIINNDGTDSIVGNFANVTEGSTIIAGGYTFNITYEGGTGNDVVLMATGIEPCSTLQIANLTALAIDPSVTIPVNATDLTGRGVIGADFKLTYDPTVVSPSPADISVVPGTVAPGATVTYNAATPGMIFVSVFGSTPFTGPGSLVTVNMRAIGIIGAMTPLTISNLLYNGGTVCSTATSGSLTLISGATSGRVTFRNRAFPVPPVPTPTVAVPGVLLTGTGSVIVDTTTNSSGDYLLLSFGPGAYTVTPSRPAYLSGSNNGIFANDAALIARHVVGLISLSPTQIEAGTVNSFGIPLSSFDAGLIAQWIVGINAPSNRTGQWRFTPPFTTPDVNLNNTQNYGAMLLGDVNGDWNPLGPRPARVVDDEARSRAVIVSLGSIKAVHGTEFTIPLSITNLRDVSVDSYQFDIEFDADVITPAEIAADLSVSVADGLSIASFSPERGVLKVAVYGAFPVKGDGVYANLHFTANAKLGAKSELTITNFRLGDGSEDVLTTKGEVLVIAKKRN